MSDDVETAQRGIEHAAQEHEHGDRGARRVAVLISVLAAALALAEMQEKGAQNAYMTHHIEVSDGYAFYQAKTVRANLYALHADLLAALPNAADPAIKQQIEAARATAARLEDDEKTVGRKQLLARAEAIKTQREESFRHYERFEIVVGALQIAIVLASVSVVTRIRSLALVAGSVGVAAMAAGVLVATGLL